MSRTKKAVIIGSVLVGIGVIIGFIGIAIGGFKFPNGAVDLTTMKALHTEKKTVQIADAFDKIEIAGASSMDIEICKSKTGKNYVEYYDTDDWTSHVDVKDHVLKFTTDDKGKHKAIVSLGFGKDTRTRIYLTDAEYKEIAVSGCCDRCRNSPRNPSARVSWASLAKRKKRNQLRLLRCCVPLIGI